MKRIKTLWCMVCGFDVRFNSQDGIVRKHSLAGETTPNFIEGVGRRVGTVPRIEAPLSSKSSQAVKQSKPGMRGCYSAFPVSEVSAVAYGCTVTAINLALVTVDVIDILVDPVMSGVKLVTTPSEPPGMVTELAIVPTAGLLSTMLTVTDWPPASCCVPAKLLSGFSTPIATVKAAGPLATLVK